MVYALQKFQHYLLGVHFKMYIDHSTQKYLVNKPMLRGKTCRWLLLFQEYDFEVIVKLGCLNVGPHHLSQIEIGDGLQVWKKGCLMCSSLAFASQMITSHIKFSFCL